MQQKNINHKSIYLHKNQYEYINKDSNKKLRKAKKLYVKARAFRVVNKKRSYGKWTKAKRIKK